MTESKNTQQPTLSAIGLADTQPDAQFDQATQLAASRFHIENCLLAFFDRDAGRLYCKSQTGPDEQWASHEQTRLFEAICRHVMDNRASVAIPDTRTHPLTRDTEGPDGLRADACLAAPVCGMSGAAIGMICLAGRKPRNWEPQEVADLEILAHCISSLVSYRMAIWQLRQELLHAEAQTQTKADMLADVSHEIRTPLNGLLGMAGALEQTGLTPVQQQMLELMEQAGNQLRRLADDLLDIAQLEGGALTMPDAPFRPTQTVEAVIALADATNQGPSPPLEFEDAIGAATVLIGSEMRIHQVLANLLENAAAFNPEGPVRIRAALSDESSDGNAILNLSVIDSGPGVPKESKDIIFERFRQGPRPKKQNRNGAGLGLTIARAVCQRHGGNLRVEDTPGGGATFVATFL